MKTIVIWDDCEASLRFFVVEGDYSHLNGVYLNSCAAKNLDDQLNTLIAYDDCGQPQHKMLDEFPLDECYSYNNDKGPVITRPDIKVIVCGFIRSFIP